jgi:hypothetical protein
MNSEVRDDHDKKIARKELRVESNNLRLIKKDAEQTLINQLEKKNHK